MLSGLPQFPILSVASASLMNGAFLGASPTGSKDDVVPSHETWSQAYAYW